MYSCPGFLFFIFTFYFFDVPSRHRTGYENNRAPARRSVASQSCLISATDLQSNYKTLSCCRTRSSPDPGVPNIAHPRQECAHDVWLRHGTVSAGYDDDSAHNGLGRSTSYVMRSEGSAWRKFSAKMANEHLQI